MIIFSRSNIGEQLLIPMFKNDPIKTGVAFQTVTTVIHFIVFPFMGMVVFALFEKAHGQCITNI